MGFAFNPFTGNFDQKGSGGGASYIDGEEAVYGDLSLDAGVAPLNSAWLVRSSSGIWPFNKPGGIYIRTATGGVSRDADYTYAGTMPDVFSDAVLTIYDEASTTRTGQFNLGSVTAGQNRVLTWPDGNGTIARTEDFASPPAIGNTTPAAGSFTTLSANNGTLTASAPVLDLAQTWNNAAVTFTGLRVNVTDTASAAASVLASLQTGGVRQLAVTKTGNIQFKDNTGGGLTANPVIFDFGSNQYWCHLRFAGSNLYTFQQNGVFMLQSGLLQVGPNYVQRESGKGSLQFNTGSTATEDSIILTGQTNFTSTNCAIRNGTNAQTFRIYNTFTDASNYERGFMRWSSNNFEIGTEAGGTGTVRETRIVVGTATYRFASNNSAIFSGTLNIAATAEYQWFNRSIMSSSASGIILLTNSARDDWSRLQFGGTTSSFPALKRSSTTLQVRLADDSAFAPFACAGLTLNGDLTASTRNIVTDTTTGTRIGTGTTQLLGFWNATPAAQPAAVADATDAASTQARLNDLLARLRTIGIIAT